MKKNRCVCVCVCVLLNHFALHLKLRKYCESVVLLQYKSFLKNMK